MGHSRYFLLNEKVEDVMIDERNFLDQPIKHYLRKYENIRKITTYQGDNHTTGCLLDYNHF